MKAHPVSKFLYILILIIFLSTCSSPTTSFRRLRAAPVSNPTASPKSTVKPSSSLLSWPRGLTCTDQLGRYLTVLEQDVTNRLARYDLREDKINSLCFVPSHMVMGVSSQGLIFCLIRSTSFIKTAIELKLRTPTVIRMIVGVFYLLDFAFEYQPDVAFGSIRFEH
jgi:hypothetical protein